MCYRCSCIVPGIGLETPILDYGRCFIRYPYENMVVLKNETDLPAKYELLPQVISKFVIFHFYHTCCSFIPDLRKYVFNTGCPEKLSDFYIE